MFLCRIISLYCLQFLVYKRLMSINKYCNKVRVKFSYLLPFLIKDAKGNETTVEIKIKEEKVKFLKTMNNFDDISGLSRLEIMGAR